MLHLPFEREASKSHVIWIYTLHTFFLFEVFTFLDFVITTIY